MEAENIDIQYYSEITAWLDYSLFLLKTPNSTNAIFSNISIALTKTVLLCHVLEWLFVWIKVTVNLGCIDS
jgi:hypothetical protein